MRVVLAALLGAGLASLALLPEPGSLLIAFIALLLGFLLAAAKAAVDLIELTPSELAADTVALIALGLALTRVTTGDAVLVGSLLAVACVAQGLPRAVTMVR